MPKNTEKLSFIKPSGLEGVTMMSVENSLRLWRAYHDTYGICTVLNTNLPKESHADIRYRNNVYKIGRGWLSLMEPGELHVTERTTDPGTFWVMHLAPDLFRSFAEELGLKARPHFKTGALYNRFVFEAFREFHLSIAENDALLSQHDLFHQALEALFRYAAEEFLPEAVAKVDPRCIVRVREHIHDCFDQNLSLLELAQEAGISTFHLNRTFRENVGLPPHKYQLCIRIAQAERLLRSGESPARVAADVGFCDESHLLRHFKKLMGVSPGRYQREHTDGIRR